MNRKKLLMFALPILAIAMVSALTYYAYASVTVNVNQPIDVSGSLEQTIDCDAGEVCLGEMIRVDNSADNERTISLRETGSGSDIDVSYVGKLELTTKDTETWEATEDRKVDLIYTLVGEEFNTEVELESGEVLVYALDHDDRFVNYASVIKVEDIDGNLPYSEDWNLDADPNYCDLNNGFDSYEHCNGAKLWIVKESDLGEAVDGVYPLSWANMNAYLYETDLIRYFDNADGQITIPAGSFVEFYPQFSVDNYAPDQTRIVNIYVE